MSVPKKQNNGVFEIWQPIHRNHTKLPKNLRNKCRKKMYFYSILVFLLYFSASSLSYFCSCFKKGCFFSVCLLNYFNVLFFIRNELICAEFSEQYFATCAFQMNDWMNEWVFFGTQMQPWFMIWNNIEHWKIYGVRSIPFRANQKCTKIQQRTYWIQNTAVQYPKSRIQQPTNIQNIQNIQSIQRIQRIQENK